MAVDPAFADDEDVAFQIMRDLTDPESGLLRTGETIVEARGAHTLRRCLSASGWIDDEPWTPMSPNLSGELDVRRLQRASLRIEYVGADAAETWTSVHWSAFKGTRLDVDARDRSSADG